MKRKIPEQRVVAVIDELRAILRQTDRHREHNLRSIDPRDESSQDPRVMEYDMLARHLRQALGALRGALYVCQMIALRRSKET